MSKETILQQFSLFSLGSHGIGSWLTENTDYKVFDRLDKLHETPLSRAQFNQLLVFGNQAPVSHDFFHYYWLESPMKHPYPVEQLPAFDPQWTKDTNGIMSLSHLEWGLYRLFTDALLYFGNVQSAFRTLRLHTKQQLIDFFDERQFNTCAISERGAMLPMHTIPQDNRYLISEQACKSFGDGSESESEMRQALELAYETFRKKNKNRGTITFKNLLTGDLPESYSNRQGEFEFSMDDILNESITSKEDFDQKFGGVAEKYFAARKAALNNTQHYLSMVSDLDVYVATSMRTRQDFREMANFCDDVFSDTRLTDINIRYFDPTLSAAFGHEDKGLIECLMVKCAKVLVYCAGKSESYGKDAEAAMALSLGKPVIFFCDGEQKSRFYRDVHPLSRLIEFETGVAVGAMVTDDISKVKALLSRLLQNKMQYRLEQHPSRKGYLMLKEQLTDSVVRLQTNDQMLTETFWNHYHASRKG